MISSRRGNVRNISEEGKGECRKMPHLGGGTGRGGGGGGVEGVALKGCSGGTQSLLKRVGSDLDVSGMTLTLERRWSAWEGRRM